MPDLKEFMEAPVADIAVIAPTTMVVGIGGTRRRAALAGISTGDPEYVAFSQKEMFACFDLIFEHGIKHVFTSIVMHTNFNEVGPYKDRLIERIQWGIAGDEALSYFRKAGWKVRLFGADAIPALQASAILLEESTPQTATANLWFTATTTMDQVWQQMLVAAQGAKTQKELIRNLYGEDIPPATLYLGFGKAEIYGDLVPPALMGKLQCYWRQGLGYSLTKDELRRILYDYAYTRNTYKADKTDREQSVLSYRQLYDNPPIIGLGQRIGPFWYPINEDSNLATSIHSNV